MDGGISDVLNGVLSNPDALNKIMALMPAVAQMMNGGGSNNINTEKIIDAAPVNANKPDISADNLMANAEVMTALKNLITAISNTASANNNAELKPEAIPAVSIPNVPVNNNTENKIEKTLDTLKNFSSATSPESDHRLRLLLALKPFLKEGRQTKIDSAIKYMNAAKIINMFGKNGFV